MVSDYSYYCIMSSLFLLHTHLYIDLFIYSNNGRIEIKTYCKPSDAHSYLLPQSCHPTHIAENIPYGVAHRVYKNCSERDEYLKSKSEFTKYLEERNYNISLITKSFDKIEKVDRDSLISSNSTNSSNKNSERCFPLACYLLFLLTVVFLITISYQFQVQGYFLDIRCDDAGIMNYILLILYIKHAHQATH